MSTEPYRMLVLGLSRNRAGVESYILNMARAFSRQAVQFFFPANGAEETYGEELEAMGHCFIRTPVGRGRHFIRYYREWNRIFREYHFDAVYLNDCSVVQLDLLKLARWHKVPVRVFHAHSSAWFSPSVPLRHRLMAAWNKKHLHSIATRLLCCSDEAADWMFPPHSHYDVIRNAVDVQKLAYSPSTRSRIRQEFAVGEAPLIGYIGRFDAEKNPVYFVHTFAALRKRMPEARALMVGDGVLRPEVEEAVRQAGLPEGSIHLAGVRRDVAAIMSALDCMVMTSLVEGFPYVLVEAQASGLPCVVSDRVPPETNITGLLRFVSLEHPADWVSALSQTLQAAGDRSVYPEKLREKGYDSRAVFAALQEDIMNAIKQARA